MQHTHTQNSHNASEQTHKRRQKHTFKLHAIKAQAHTPKTLPAHKHNRKNTYTRNPEMWAQQQIKRQYKHNKYVDTNKPKYTDIYL